MPTCRTATRLPLPQSCFRSGCPQLLVHGGSDDIVPLTQSADFARAAREAGDEVDEIVFTGGDHFDVVDVDHPTWHDTAGWLAARLG